MSIRKDVIKLQPTRMRTVPQPLNPSPLVPQLTLHGAVAESDPAVDDHPNVFDGEFFITETVGDTAVVDDEMEDVISGDIVTDEDAETQFWSGWR